MKEQITQITQITQLFTTLLIFILIICLIPLNKKDKENILIKKGHRNVFIIEDGLYTIKVNSIYKGVRTIRTIFICNGFMW